MAATRTEVEIYELVPMHLRLQLGLALNLIVFATLLNSVGIVIERSIAEWAVSKTIGGTLEGCKDLTIALTSVLLSSQVTRIGYRRTMLGGLVVVSLASAAVAASRAFISIPLLFILCGASFALVKVAVYSTVGLISRDSVQHASMMNRLEGIYQLGAMASPLVFARMIEVARWTDTYWLISLLAALSFVVWLGTPLDEGQVAAAGSKAGLAEMLSLLKRPLVLVFLACAWIYVMIEQSVGTWLPTFNRDVFRLSPELAASLLSVYFGSVAASRFAFGPLARRLSVFWLQLLYLTCAFVLTGTVLYLTRGLTPAPASSLGEVPRLAIAFTLLGFLIGPIYPTLNSLILNSLEKHQQSSMTGLIIIFSALGGTSGSQVIGYLSEHYTTHAAFHFTLLPIALLFALVIVFEKMRPRD